MKMYRSIHACLFGACSLSASLAQSTQAQTVAELWENNCVSCHGADGSGQGDTPTLVSGPVTAHSDRAYFDSVRDGHAFDGRPAFAGELTEQQMWGVVVFLREKQARERLEEQGNPTPTEAGVYEAKHHPFRVEDVVTDGLSTPWSVDFLPDGRMLIANRPGTLMISREGSFSTVRGTPEVRHRGQGGLLDVAPHPAFEENGWIYLSYSDKLERNDRSPGMTKVVRGTIRRGNWENEQVVFEADTDDYLPTDLHFGCRLVFEKAAAPGPRDATHYLYFAIGERGRADHAQDLARPNGKVHRLWDNGDVPDDNPFVGRSRTDPGVYASIWSYGHRNPQGLAFDTEGRLWDTEHGPRGGDEINLVQKGRNFGWPLVSFGMNYNGTPFRTPFPDVSAPGQDIAMPSAIWLPSIGACGLDVVRPGSAGEAFPEWRNDLIAGGLSGANVDRFRFAPESDAPGGYRVVERETLLRGMGRVRDVVCGPEGSVYVVLNGPDKVVRLVPAD